MAPIAEGPTVDVMRPDVSIIVVNWNTRDLLRDCLRSVNEQSCGIRHEVVVVDNASSDGSADMVRTEFPDVHLVANMDNRGFAAGNNQGLAVATGRYVLLLNPDTRILDRAIERAVAVADAHPQAGVVGCRAVFPDGRLQMNCYRFPSLLNLFLSLTHLAMVFPNNRFFGRQRLTWWAYDTPREVDVVAGCFMLVRREALEQVGPMAESYFMYSEDTDWCWRFHRRGWKTLYTPDATIVHLLEASSSQCAADMRVMQRRALLMFLEMKSGKLTRYLANAMFAVAGTVRVVALGVKRLMRGRSSEDLNRQWESSTAALRFHLMGRMP